MSPAPNSISPQQGGIAGTTVGNVPGAANTGLGSSEAPALEGVQSVVGETEVLAGAGIEPLDKDVGGVNAGSTEVKDAQKILDDLSAAATSTTPSASEALSSAQATVTEALGSAATTAQGLANQAYEAVMGGGEDKK